MTEGMSTKDIQSEECKDKTDVKSTTLLCNVCTRNREEQAVKVTRVHFGLAFTFCITS